MKIYNKKRLELKERVIKKSNTILKEDDTVYFNNVTGMADALNRDGDVTVSNNVDQKSIDVPIMTTNNKVTPQDLNNSEALKSAINVAKTQPNTNVEITANKVSGKVTPINNTTNPNASINEGQKFSKKEMTMYLKTM